MNSIEQKISDFHKSVKNQINDSIIDTEKDFELFKSVTLNLLQSCSDKESFEKSWSGDLQKQFPNGVWRRVNGARVFINNGKVVAGLNGFNQEIDKFFENKKKEGKNNVNWSNSLEYIQQKIFSSRKSQSDLLDEKRLNSIFSKNAKFLSNKNPLTNPDAKQITKDELRDKFFEDKINTIKKRQNAGDDVKKYQYSFGIDGGILQREFDKRVNEPQSPNKPEVKKEEEKFEHTMVSNFINTHRDNVDYIKYLAKRAFEINQAISDLSKVTSKKELSALINKQASSGIDSLNKDYNKAVKEAGERILSKEKQDRADNPFRESLTGADSNKKGKVENKPYHINKHGTQFYDYNKLKKQDIEVTQSNKTEDIHLIRGNSIKHDTVELETKERYKNKIGDYEYEAPYSTAEIGKNINGKYYVEHFNIQGGKNLARFNTQDEAIEFAKTVMAISTENKKKGVKSTQFIDGEK